VTLAKECTTKLENYYSNTVNFLTLYKLGTTNHGWQTFDFFRKF